MSHCPSPITVLDLRDSPWVDGPGRTVLDCAEMIDSSRIRIVIGAFDGGRMNRSAYEQDARRRGLEVFRIRERSSLDFRVLQQVIGLGRSLAIDIVHSHDFRTNILGYACARRLNVPLIATVHGWIANDLKGRIRTALDRWVLRGADHVISVSEETRSRLGSWANNERCTVIPNALCVQNFEPGRVYGELKASLGLPSDTTLVANIGRLSPEKGQAAFLAAARDLARDHRAVHFILIGIGPDQVKLENLVSSYGLEGRVTFAGFRRDMEATYREIDLVVQSSFTEGMPNVVLESLLMEVPVIATDVGGTREVVKGDTTGILIPPGDHGALVSAIEEFLINPQALLRMAREGRKDVCLRFDHAQRVERLAEVYERVISNRRRKD